MYLFSSNNIFNGSQDTERTCFYPLICVTKARIQNVLILLNIVYVRESRNRVNLFLSSNLYDRSQNTKYACFHPKLNIMGVRTQSVFISIHWSAWWKSGHSLDLFSSTNIYIESQVIDCTCFYPLISMIGVLVLIPISKYWSVPRGTKVLVLLSHFIEL